MGQNNARGVIRLVTIYNISCNIMTIIMTRAFSHDFDYYFIYN